MVEFKKPEERGVRQVRPGAAPGTPIVDPRAPAPVIRAICYGPDRVHEETVTDLDRLLALGKDWPVVWINVDGLGDAAVLARIGEIFGLHRLALEDVIHVHQRPKVEEYEDRVFLVTRLQTLTAGLSTEQISFFLGPGFVLSFQEKAGDCFDPVRERIRGGRGKIRTSGADYLLYALLDSIVDANFPILEDLGDRLETLEDEILDIPRADTLGQIHAIKRDLIVMRRIIWPFREAIAWLLRDSSSLIQQDTVVYLRDAYDHAVRVMDLVEGYRELCADLTDLYLSSNSNRLNEVMGLLTTTATIFIPMTFIAGVYGMNFDTSNSPWNMPELHWYYGYPACILLMLAVATAMLLYFRSRGWLGMPKRRDRRSARRKTGLHR